MPTLDDYRGQVPAWCPGCGNFGILNAVRKTFVGLGIEPHQVVMVSGIGQAAKLPHYTRCNIFNGLHGRTLPVATGVALANHELLTIVETGDGDCYAEGGNHFVHAIRRNVNVKLFVHDNQIYGLTKGQASPTSEEGMVTKLQPFGVLAGQENPLALAIALDCSFVARGFAGDMDFLQHLMSEAIRHKGFALIDILQPCVTFNRVNTFKWYGERVYRLEEGYDPADRAAAFERAREWGARIPIGILYRKERPLFEERVPVIRETPLVRQPFDFARVKEEANAFF
ncbi:MAG: 2-oxoacid:ferredoxin oxidoreductase subunit beta [Desulfobacteraceae bacterium]|nr:2-oxoacid:ferredoxin oxidoreductase subunit beta [Desulfobacteraceae bacterium]